MAEDAAAAQMAGAQATPELSGAGRRRPEGPRGGEGEAEGGRLQRRARHADRQRQRAGDPGGGPTATFDGYYDWAGGAVYAPGYLETDTVVHVVSNLYSLDQNKLVWSGTSKTFDPASAK